MLDRARDMMERQLQHLIRLVDDLLDVSRIMRGKIELRIERLDAREVVGAAPWKRPSRCSTRTDMILKSNCPARRFGSTAIRSA